MKTQQLRILPALMSLCCVLLLPAGSSGGEKREVYTLRKSIEEALSNNWSLKARLEKIEQAAQVKNQARAEFLPKLSTSYGYTRLSETPTTDLSLPPPLTGGEVQVGLKDNYQWKGTVTQPLFTGFALTSSYELAKLGIDQSRLEVEQAKLDLVLQVKETYFRILKADKALDVARRAEEALESHVKVAQNFYDVGMIPINELLKAEVELSNAQHDLVRAQNAAKLARASFNTTLSRPIDSPVQVEDILVFKPLVVGSRGFFEKALESRPELKALETRIRQTDQQIRLARSKNYPEVGLTYDYIKEGDTPSVSGSDYHDASHWEATIGLSWTFWEWGKTRSNILEKRSLRRELVKTKQSLDNQIHLEVKNALLEMDLAQKDIPTTRKAVKQAEENLRVSEERYKVQATTSTEVLDAQTLLTRARTNYYDALYNHNLAKARLQRAIGEY